MALPSAVPGEAARNGAAAQYRLCNDARRLGVYSVVGAPAGGRAQVSASYWPPSIWRIFSFVAYALRTYAFYYKFNMSTGGSS
eukprot:1514944-Pleurochrysis_carterae.AAC.1